MTPRPDIFPGVAKPMKGQGVTLTCSAAGTLSILRWYKDGQRVISDGKSIIINETFLQASRVSVSKLSITSAKTSDSGTYKCAVTTKLDSGYLSYIEAKIKVNGESILAKLIIFYIWNLAIIARKQEKTLADNRFVWLQMKHMWSDGAFDFAPYD